MQLIDNWRSKILRLHSMRVAILSAFIWSAAAGALMIWPALVDRIPIGIYVAGGIALSIATGIARLLKQPGADQ